MSPRRFSQRIANLFPVPPRAALVALGLFVALAALASLLMLLSSGPAPVTAAHMLLGKSTTTTVTASPSPSSYGEAVTFRAEVISSGVLVTGTAQVRFTAFDGTTTTDMGTSSVSGGVATKSYDALRVGTYLITASYLGDSVFDPSSGTTSHTVNRAQATIEIVNVSPTSPIYGQEVTIRAVVNPSIATGMVFFDDNGTEIGRAMLDNNGAAIIKTFRLAAGEHRLKAVYQGDDNFLGDESNIWELTVAKADTEIDPFVSSDDDSVYGQYVSFTATVLPDPVRTGSTTPTGLVTFWSNDGTYLLPMGQGVLNGEGQAWFGTSGLAVGDYTITASYEGDANYNPSDEDLGQDVDKADTSVAVTGPGSSYYGKSVTFEAKVSVVPPGAGSPTGKVEFTGWGDSLEATLFDGKASFMPLEPHDVGSVTISAEYKGDENFKSSTGTKDHTVTPALTTTELQDLLDETDYGQDAQFLISVKRHEDQPGSGIPTGIVILSAGPLVITETLPANSSVVTIITNTLPPGDHAAWSLYSGDTNFLPSVSTVVTHTVNKADSETSLVSSANPSAFGQSVTFTATVEAAGLGLNAPITPTGTVTFTLGTVAVVTRTLDASGVATVVTDTLPAGEHKITAEYSGDSSFKPSEDSLRQTVNTIATTTQLSGLSSSAVGDSVTFTATVSETLSGDPVTDGDVTFYDGVTVLDTKTLVAGVATYTTSSLSVGTHRIKAVYNGTANFQPSTSQRLSHTVSAAGSTTTLTSSQNPSVYGQNVTFQATVTAAGTPTGEVTFKDGAATLGTAPLVGGVATFSTAALAVGTHPITAVYGGDASFAGSTSNQVNQVVNKANTTTTITSDLPDPSVVGQPVVVSFTVVANAPGSGTPTGNVTVDDGTASCTGSVAAGTCTLTPTTAGAKTLTATYAGDSNFNGSSDTEDHQVNAANTTTTVTTSPPSSLPGQNVTITANVTANPPGAGTPTGQVQFKSNGSNIGGPVALVGGSASVNTSFASEGAYNITADYSGDGNFINSSGSTTHNVSATPTDLSVTKTDSPDPVNVGDNLTYVIVVTNHGPESTEVTLTDTLPPQVTFVSATHSQGSCTTPNVGDPGGTVTCNLGTMASGGSATVTIVVNVPLTTPAGTVLRNTAQVSGTRPDPDLSNNTSIQETTVYRAPRRGDCNGDDAVDLADVWAIVRHIFDPTFQGTSGCDANRDGQVDAGDVPSTVLIMFNGARSQGRMGADSLVPFSRAPLLLCSSAPLPGPALTMPDQVSASPGGLATVPVTFAANGHSITSLVFSVDYDETWLTLDPTDRDGNGVPDAVIFNLPGDFTYSVTFDGDDADGKVGIFIGDIAPPLTSLSDGPIVFLILNVDSSPGSTQGAVRFSLDPAASFGNTSGQSVPGTATPTEVRQYRIYLPVVR